MTTRQSPSELSAQHRELEIELEYAVKERNLLLLVDEERRRLRLWDAIINSALIMAGIVGTAGLLYWRAQVWAWATGDLVSFAVVLFIIAVGSLLSIRLVKGK